jgi:cysteinyl-tRNA synthetase
MVKDLLDHYSGEVLRFTILSAHYRSELNFSVDVLDAAKKTLDNLYSYLQSVTDVTTDESIDITGGDIYQALLDDLNTPIAIRELHALGKKMKAATGDAQAQMKSHFIKAASLMGLLQQDPEAWFYVEAADGEMSDADIDKDVAAMQQARQDKDYDLADEIRDKLQGQGIVLTRDGWKRG